MYKKILECLQVKKVPATKNKEEHFLFTFEAGGTKLILKFSDKDEYHIGDNIAIAIKLKNAQKEIEDFANID